MKSIKRYRGRLVFASLLALSVLLYACVNLKAVNEWSTTSLDATLYNGIVATYANTPERLKRYDPDTSYDEDIELRKNQAEALKKILSVVSDYMAALSTLSADSTVIYDADVDALTSSIGKLNAGISEATLGAVGSIVKTVLGAAAEAYQARQVSKVVEKANQPLQDILSGELRQIVDVDFRRDLMIERTMIDRYYDSLVQTGSPSSAAKVAVSEWKEVRLAENEKRIDAVNAYIKVLDKVSEGHKKIYDNRNKLDAIELAKELYPLVSELRKQIQILS